LTVNPDEILIFKMRGMKTVQKKEEKKAQIAAQPRAAAAQPAAAKPQKMKLERRPFFAPKPEHKPAPTAPEEAEAMPVQEAEEREAQKEPAAAKERKPLFAFKPKPQPAKAKAEQQMRQPEAAEEKPQQPEYSEEEQARLRELDNLEQMAALYEAPPEGLEAEESEARGGTREKEVKNIFSSIAGLMFMADAIILGYFTAPQSTFVLNYVVQNGLGALALRSGYEYGIAFVNIIFALLLIISGISLIVRAKLSHLVSGATGSIIMLSASFEYLNSNAVYLLLVSVLTFASTAALAYARMSAVVEAEQEQEVVQTPQEINWPRIETF
jgi:chemotaxis protein histidine kinase CheA